MKKMLFLILVSFVSAVVSCGEKAAEESQWFKQPVVAIDGTTVQVKCLSLLGKGVLATSESGFVYLPIFGDEGPVTVSEPMVDENILSCQLSDLNPEADYLVYAFVVVDGTQRQSPSTLFRTGKRSDAPDPDPDPDPTPDPDPAPGNTKYPGWAELPGEESKPGDYYYAYHMRADAPTVRNYSICYSASMRSAVWVAYPLHSSYDGKAGRNSSWKNDPTIPAVVQPDLTYASYKPQPGFSRGHMIASSDRQVSEATNKQTFYVTNMAPQLQDQFNGGIWQSLEQQCWKNICSDTLFVVTGAYYANKNTTTMDQSNQTVIVPTHFYKVLMRSKSGKTGKALWQLSADEIQCVGFWFEHKNYSGSVPSQFMTSVGEIERTVGFTLFPNVPKAPKAAFNRSDWSF